MAELSIVIVLLLVGLGFGGYLFLMLFYPEWVGITGDAARKTMAEHEEGSKADDSDFFEKPKDGGGSGGGSDSAH
jgi:hypothetical protein